MSESVPPGKYRVGNQVFKCIWSNCKNTEQTIICKIQTIKSGEIRRYFYWTKPVKVYART